MEFIIKQDEIQNYNNICKTEFPKYTSQLINWANQNAQGTRPKHIGQLSDLFPEFQRSAGEINVHNWENWYLQKYPDVIENVTNKIVNQIDNLKEAIQLIDRNLIEKWVKDFVINKTFAGFNVQYSILSALADKLNLPFRIAAPTEESDGIDGFVGDTPYSIKPASYKSMGRLSENIGVKKIFYSKNKQGLTVEIED